MLGTDQEKIHTFYSESREGIRISGVSDVISFDEAGISLETLCGSMGVEGEGLRVKTLNTNEGVVEIDGKISGVYYFDKNPPQKRTLFGRRADQRG